MIYGAELRKQIMKRKDDFLADRKARNISINEGHSSWEDGWLSDMVSDDSIRECDMQLEILDTDGMMDFDAIFDDNGKEISFHWFVNQWGKSTVVANGVFASSIPALLKKTGWTEKTIRVPVWTKFVSANGFGRTQKVRWHTNMVTGEYVGYPD